MHEFRHYLVGWDLFQSVDCLSHHNTPLLPYITTLTDIVDDVALVCCITSRTAKRWRRGQGKNGCVRHYC